MIKAIKQSKWYWYIPFVYLFCIHEMSMWTLSADEEIDRGWRMIITTLLMFPTILIFFYLLIYFKFLP